MPRRTLWGVYDRDSAVLRWVLSVLCCSAVLVAAVSLALSVSLGVRLASGRAGSLSALAVAMLRLWLFSLPLAVALVFLTTPGPGASTFFGDRPRPRLSLLAVQVLGAAYAVALPVLVWSQRSGEFAALFGLVGHPRTFARLLTPLDYLLLAGACLGTLVWSLVAAVLAVYRKPSAASIAKGYRAMRDEEDPLTRSALHDAAIASGVPVPRMFVIEDRGSLNAVLVDGSGGPVVVVTRGLLERLDEDEERFVYSHLVECFVRGDARLAGWLAGLSRPLDVMPRISPNTFLTPWGSAPGFADVAWKFMSVMFAAGPFGPAIGARIVTDLVAFGLGHAMRRTGDTLAILKLKDPASALAAVDHILTAGTAIEGVLPGGTMLMFAEPREAEEWTLDVRRVPPLVALVEEANVTDPRHEAG